MIDVLSPQLDYDYADFWGQYLPPTLEFFRPLIGPNSCYLPRWWQVPNNKLQDMLAGDYSVFTLALPAGSMICSIMHSAQEGVSGSFTLQVTDTALDHQWFSQPAPDEMFFKTSGRNPYYLPKPYLVVTPGNFLIERWCRVAGSCEVVFGVAVPGPAMIPVR
jgi:hypothetical protein